MGGDAGRAPELLELSKALDHAVACCGNCAFVKLSTRSPKDSIVIRKRRERAPHTFSPSAASKDGAECPELCVTSGEDALELLCGSQRVLDDLEIVNSAGVWAVPGALVVRRWIDFPRWGELRAFVCAKKLSALSSYYKAHPAPVMLISNREQVESAVRYLVSSMANVLPCHGWAVLDLALIFIDGSVVNWACENVTVTLLEINPWGRA